MHQKPLQEYSDLLKRLHQERLVHTLDELAGLFNELSNYLNAAVNRSAIEPYQNMSKKLHEDLTRATKAFRDTHTQLRKEHPDLVRANRGTIGLGLAIECYPFLFPIDLSRADDALTHLHAATKSLEQRMQDFTYAHESISNHIQMEVLPNDALDGERTLLAQGYFVFPTTLQSEGFFVFKYMQNTCPCCKDTRAIVFELTDEYGSSSLEEAMAQYVPHNTLGSVIIARNTEKYPLSETVMPILAEKYDQKVKEESYN